MSKKKSKSKKLKSKKLKSKKLKSKWVAALRSGDYQQCSQVLKNKRGEFCCLGVLCDLLPGRWRKLSMKEERDGVAPICARVFVPVGESPKDDEGDTGVLLPASIREKVGLSLAQQERLAHMNDTRESFEEIASYIEREL